MSWSVQLDEKFEEWLQAQEDDLRLEILARLNLLQEEGPKLSRPYADTIRSSQYSNMKELRIQHHGKPWRIMFAFDPKQSAIILLGGNKTGDDRWYKKNVPIADKRFTEHLESLRRKEEDIRSDST
jgi:hypothetical protein